MRAYKLLALRQDLTLGPLFINKKQVIPIGEWLEAEDHPTKGFAHRPGWHSCEAIVAPHLTMKGRIWCEVEIEDYEDLKRPKSQGSRWFLSQRMKVIRKLEGVVHQNPWQG
jgi:hypothetical protein